MHRLCQLAIMAYIIVSSGIPSYTAADEVKFGVIDDNTPAWLGGQSEGHLQTVRSGDEWFHVYPEGLGGERPYQQTFDWVGPFSEGLAPARLDGREFHIRMDGSRAYEVSYDAVGPFNNGYAPAVQDGNWFHIRTDGTRPYTRNFKLVSGVYDSGRADAIEKSQNLIRINMKGERE